MYVKIRGHYNPYCISEVSAFARFQDFSFGRRIAYSTKVYHCASLLHKERSLNVMKLERSS
jgi:hypothetical protein